MWPKRALGLFAVVLVAATGAFLVWPAGFRQHSHVTAAVGAFFGILSVVLLSAFAAPGPAGTARSAASSPA